MKISGIKFRFAVNILLFLFSALIIFHLLVLAGIIPYNIVWGSRLENVSQMYKFELVSVIINLIFITIVAMKGGYIRALLPGKILTIAFWIFTALFFLNTIGNIFSESIVEAIIFTPVTMVSTVLCLRLAIQKS